MENNNSVFSDDDMIAAASSSLERISNNMYAIVDKFRSDIAKPDDKEDVAIAQCILQMAICKTQSLLQLSGGISIVPDRKDIRLYDPTSMVAILRSLYELVFTFRNIYLMTITEKERKILLNIWKICGLNNRQKEEFPTEDLPQRYREQREKEAKDIEKMKQEILSVLSTMDITESAQKGIENIVKEIIKKKDSSIKGYIFERAGSCITSLKRISLTKSPRHIYKTSQLGIMYTLFSMYTHPSYLSMLQFGQMYNNGQYKKLLKDVLTSACILNAHLIQDFCQVVPKCQEFYEQMEGVKMDEEFRNI